MRAGCGVGAGRAGRASTPFHAGTAGPGRARTAAHATLVVVRPFASVPHLRFL